VGAGAGFGVILNAKGGQAAVAKALDGAIVEVDVRHHAAVGFEAFLIDGKAVVLAGDFHAVRVEILHRLIRAAMAEFQFVRRRADGPAEKLMAEADAEDRDLAQNTDDRFDRIIEHGRIARTVADEQAVGFKVENLLSRRVRRQDRHADAALAEVAEDVGLGAAVHGHNVQTVAALDLAKAPIALTFAPVVRF